ncbi:hypothetical protein SAMD00019534_039570 [Acytostelium subglobosum LB1]|uniref:hypothetical protein n=1 Tax=Acytostelium subglobosum LB1 TaxID=1410327 RepID=UPI000645137F|nr:hypothetical protein SAMD00019534_039570 [Acytostelium subglobosum LB1]GAM20782.1 hypothetical protein SAMD00019534_039570 [Acytostelium subglobosum LB1]|eukprot:XP_012755916.1 hypothetical protein SAMD00019534_039570 [Acytostelium subglobosum LB1]
MCRSGGDRENQISATDKAVLDLKVQRDKLKQYQQQINVVIQKEINIAKECTKNNKKKQALLALKKKKYQEKLLEETDQNLLNIQEMISKIEQAEFQAKIFESLQKGNAALKQLQKELSLEDVENIMAETEEAIEYQNEISKAMSGQFSSEEEDELLAELEEIEKQQLQYPEVPNNDIKIDLDHILPVKLPTSDKEPASSSSNSTAKAEKARQEPQLAM